MSLVQGTFTAPGQSPEFVIKNGRYAISFGGGTVHLERELTKGGIWVTAEIFTADDVGNLDGGGFNYRLNCTAYSSDIDYEIHAE